MDLMELLAKLLGIQSERKLDRSCTQNYIPIKDIIDGVLVLEDDRLIKIMEVEPSNFEMKTAEEQMGIITQYYNWLRTAPQNFQIKVLSKNSNVDSYLEKAVAALQNETSESCRELIENYISFLKKNSTSKSVEHHFYLIFEHEHSTSEKFFQKKEQSEKIQELNRKAVQIESVLQSMGNRIVKSDNPVIDISAFLYNYYNRGICDNFTFDDRVNRIISDSCALNKTTPENLPAADIRDLVSPNSLNFTHRDCVIQDGLYKSHLVIKAKGGYPDSMEPGGWLSWLLNLGEGFEVDLYYSKTDTMSFKRKLDALNRLKSAQLNDKGEYASNRYEAEASVQAIRNLKDCIEQAGEDVYYMTVMVTVYADRYDQLLLLKSELIHACAQMNISFDECDQVQEEAYLTAGPYNLVTPKIYNMGKRNVPQSAVAYGYPFTSFSLSDSEGVMLGTHRTNGSLVMFDNFSKDMANGNIFIAGGSGRGKSFTLMTMTSRLRFLGVQNFIISPEKQDEFRRICDALDGVFIDMSPSSRTRINVFDIWPIDSEANDLINGVVQSEEKSWLVDKVTSLETWFKYLIPNLSLSDKALINQALMKTYEKKGITTDNDSIYLDKEKRIKKEMPIFSDLMEELEKTDRLSPEITIILSQFTSGSASNLNGQTNVDLDNKYIVFGLEHLQGDLQAPMMYLCLEFIWSICRADKTKKKLISIDEGWILLDGNRNSKFVGDAVINIFKVARGYSAACILSTQSLSDLYRGAENYGNAILSCAHSSIILGMEPKEISLLRDELGLTDNEVAMITQYQKGQALLCAGANHIEIQVLASEMENRLFTTTRDDLIRIANERKNNAYI